MEKKAVIAMSGGVDSAVAAYIMKQRGFSCIGATMKLFVGEDIGILSEHSCCSLSDVADARSVADALGMAHYVFDFSERFKETVIDKFVKAYENGCTPNPCIDCNRYLKFEKLFSKAAELGYDYVVTGHYAVIEHDPKTGRYILKKAADETKDQSYVLYSLTQEQLAHTLFPLGGMRKTEVRKIAEANGFVNAGKHDSQDICFVKNGSYADFIEQYTGNTFPEGDFVSADGSVLGRHRGIIRYTVGQRKGLGLALPQPMYVCRIDVPNNKVVLGTEEELKTLSLTARNINLISVPEISRPMRVRAKVRYRQSEQWATAVQTDTDELKVEFDSPQRAVTKGQAVVLYDEDAVVGGGVIQ